MEKINSGILSLDLALGGGIPLNKITEISGPPNSSKTSIILNLIKNNPDCITAYLDTDNSINYDYLTAMGIDTDSLVISHPENAEQLIQIVETLTSNKAVDIIVVDSIATIISKDESMLSNSTTNTITDTIKKLSSLIYRSDSALILVNQLRNDLKAKKYGAMTTIANRALDSYATIRLNIEQTNEIHKYDQIIGAILKISIKKNKIAKKGDAVAIKHYYESGIDTLEDLLELACNANIIDKSGSWYSYGGLKIQGKQSMIIHLRQSEDLTECIYNRVMNYYFKGDN